MSTFASAIGKTTASDKIGAVVQLVRMPACHAGGRGFESLPHRKTSASDFEALVLFFLSPTLAIWTFWVID